LCVDEANKEHIVIVVFSRKKYFELSMYDSMYKSAHYLQLKYHRGSPSLDQVKTPIEKWCYILKHGADGDDIILGDRTQSGLHL